MARGTACRAPLLAAHLVVEDGVDPNAATIVGYAELLAERAAEGLDDSGSSARVTTPGTGTSAPNSLSEEPRRGKSRRFV